MGLNDDVDEGLESGTEFPDINPEQPYPEQTTFITDITNVGKQDSPTDEQLFGENVVANELPNINAQFVLTTESYYKLEDLISVRSDIVKSRGVCMEDANILSNQIPGFINEERPIGFFTEDKTRTQYSETLNTIDKAIDAQTAEIVIKALDTAEKSCKALSTGFKDIEAKIISKLSTIQDDIAKLSLFLAKHPEESYHAHSFLRVLDKSLSGVLDKEDEGDKTKMDQNPQFVSAFNSALTFLSNYRNLSNVQMLLWFATYPKALDTKSIYHYVNFGSLSTIDENDLVVNLESSVAEKVRIPSFTVYHLVLGGSSELAKNYLLKLASGAMKMVSNINDRRNLISNIDKTETNDYQKKLSEIFTLHSQNSIDTTNAVILMSFIQEYCDFIQAISNAFKIILPQCELTA